MDPNRTGNSDWHRSHPWLANLAIVAVYLATWLFSRLLALPPGYATPIFLPAGVGFALAAVFGWRVLPGDRPRRRAAAPALRWMTSGTAPRHGRRRSRSSPRSRALAAGLARRAPAFRRLVRPGPRLGARRRPLPAAGARLICLISATHQRVRPVPAGRAARRPSARRTGSTGGPATPSACCWRRRWSGSSAAGRARCGAGARRLVALPLLLAAGAVVAVYEQAVHWETEQHLQPYRLKAQQVADGCRPN